MLPVSTKIFEVPNYYDPSTQPFLHGLFDVVPYLLWGNDPDDFENPWPRINASVDAIGDWMGNLFHAEEVEK